MPRFRTISLSLFHTSTSLFSFFLPFFLFNSLHRYPYLFSDIGRVSKLLHGGPYSALGREPRGRSLYPRAWRSQSPTTRNSRRLRRPSDATRRLEITTKDRARNPASWMVRFVIKKTAKDVAKTERLLPHRENQTRPTKMLIITTRFLSMRSSSYYERSRSRRRLHVSSSSSSSSSMRYLTTGSLAIFDASTRVRTSSSRRSRLGCTHHVGVS